MGGKPNPGTKKDKRLSANKSSAAPRPKPKPKPKGK